MVIYSVFGWFIADQFRLVYDDRVPWDAYFSFDNYSIVTTGGGWERHPFSNYFSILSVKQHYGFPVEKLMLHSVLFFSLFSATAISFYNAAVL